MSQSGPADDLAAPLLVEVGGQPQPIHVLEEGVEQVVVDEGGNVDVFGVGLAGARVA